MLHCDIIELEHHVIAVEDQGICVLYADLDAANVLHTYQISLGHIFDMEKILHFLPFLRRVNSGRFSFS